MYGKKDMVRYKARLVAKGYSQREGIDYNEVFYSVVKYSSIRILLALVAQYELDLDQLDVNTPFLYGDLDEEIYMSQPTGLKTVGKENMVCKLKKSLYGLKQSPRQWYKRFDSFISGKRYTRSYYKPCVYYNKLPTDLGEAKKVLGMEIERDRRSGNVSLTQKEYLQKVLQRFNIDKDTKSVSTLLAPHFKLKPIMSPKIIEEREYMTRVPYASAVGSLMYAMVCTRPDLSQAVSMISRYMHDPEKGH